MGRTLNSDDNNYSLYAHINKQNNKIYIGITSQKVERRWRKGEGYKRNAHFYNSIRKYGWEGFHHSVILEKLSKKEACQLERIFISIFQTTNNLYGYNSSEGGEQGAKGANRSKEYRDNLSSRFKGENNPMFGKSHSEEVKVKISTAQKGNKNRLGATLSEEAKIKIGESNKGSKNGSAKIVVCENKEFGSLKECAEYYGVSYYTMVDWMRGKRKMRKDFIDKNLHYKEEGEF